ncbi:MAG: PucR family transcriptional regulator ligand-binding domain-containing protein, partial [Firmicutes bacterium]|nr:PucR family transcriptional regulator ligand-binding domain-containing protein [Bacillota bacterium]
MATVKDVLGLPILSQAQVVAGNSGLERPVRLVHVVDIPDITQWILPQMLLMTTGYSRFQWTSIIGELDA